jgi:hypothetical protein
MPFDLGRRMSSWGRRNGSRPPMLRRRVLGDIAARSGARLKGDPISVHSHPAMAATFTPPPFTGGRSPSLGPTIRRTTRRIIPPWIPPGLPPL